MRFFRTSSLALAIGLPLALAPRAARAGEQVLTLDGTAPTTGPQHFFVPFDVPAGTVEIEIDHDDMSSDNILDWGLLDNAGKFRGWGGGNSEPAVVASDRTSRSYVRGPMAAGTWQVVVGKAQIKVLPATYHLEIHLRDATTLAAQPERGPYVDADALTKGPRWFAGDLHVHSKESGDASPSLDQIAAVAEQNGLDFVELSDHNTVSQLDFIVDAQSRHPKMLFLPGIEWTSYAGHANGIGATKWVDHKLGIDGVTAQTAADAFAAQGALFSINHPTLDLGDLCIGCAWKLDVDPASIDGVEVINGAADLFTAQSIVFWDNLCAKGHHIAALGGSDDHSAGQDEGAFGKPIGTALTMVSAEELSTPALLAGIRAHRTVVRRDPQSPMIELTASAGLDGDTIEGEAHVTLHAKVTKGKGQAFHWVHDGVAQDDVAIDKDPFLVDLDVDAPKKGEARWRAEVNDGRPRTITSHIWIAAVEPPMGTTTTETGTDTPTDTEPGPAPKASGGCGCALPGDGRAATGGALLLLGALALAGRRRERRPG
jgi:MYXO-CTERM domain-containing protein